MFKFTKYLPAETMDRLIEVHLSVSLALALSVAFSLSRSVGLCSSHPLRTSEYGLTPLSRHVAQGLEMAPLSLILLGSLVAVTSFLGCCGAASGRR